MFVVGRKVNVLSKVEGREKREELRGVIIIDIALTIVVYVVKF